MNMAVEKVSATQCTSLEECSGDMYTSTHSDRNRVGSLGGEKREYTDKRMLNTSYQWWGSVSLQLPSYD